jgi:hypothetical protein
MGVDKNPFEWLDINRLVSDLHNIANINIDNRFYELFTHKGAAYLHTVGLANRIKQMAKLAGVELKEHDELKGVCKYLVDAFRTFGLIDPQILPEGDIYYRYKMHIKGKPLGKTAWSFIPLKADIFADTEVRKLGELLNIEYMEKVVKKD